MAVIVDEDSIEDTLGTYGVFGWEDITRGCVVSGMMANTTQPSFRLQEVRVACPAINSTHPTIPNAWLHQVVIPRCDGPDHVRVQLKYKSYQAVGNVPGLVWIKTSGALIGLQTYKDRTGAYIVVSYTNANDQVASVSVHQPCMRRSYQYVESVDPWSVALGYVGRINSTTWGGFGAGYWMCENITGIYDTKTTLWTTTYEFVLNPATWIPHAVYIDKSTNRPPPGSTPIDVDWYLTANFNTLGLP